MGEAIAIHSMVVFDVSDDRLDGRSAFHLAFDGGRDAALLSGGEDTQFVDAGRVVAPVAGIGEDALQGGAGEVFDSGITVSSVWPS